VAHAIRDIARAMSGDVGNMSPTWGLPSPQQTSVIRRGTTVKAWLRCNGLSVRVISIFLVLLIGQCLTGWQSHNEDRNRAGAPELSLPQYLSSGHFAEATSENWESEFLQMAAYVLLTVFLRQKGSAESKSFSGNEPVDRDPRLDRNKPGVPFPVRRGGLMLLLYEYSLTVAFLAPLSSRVRLAHRGRAEARE
jgi:hypothetical protein